MTPETREMTIVPRSTVYDRFYQNPRWVAGIGLVVLGVAALLWAVFSIRTAQSVQDQQLPIDRIEAAVTGPLSGANDKLDGIIAYINAQQAKADQSAAALSVATQDLNQIRTLICQSSDPIREFVCALTPIPTPHIDPAPQPAIPTTTTTQPAPTTSTATTSTVAPCVTLPNGKCRH